MHLFEGLYCYTLQQEIINKVDQEGINVFSMNIIHYLA